MRRNVISVSAVRNFIRDARSDVEVCYARLHSYCEIFIIYRELICVNVF